MSNDRIESIRIEATYGRLRAVASVAGTEVTLFAWYADEISITIGELIGLTVQQALELHRAKDVAYLRS
jgi:hypothetical protein